RRGRDRVRSSSPRRRPRASSYLEVEAALLQAPVGALVEAVKARRAVRHVLLHLAGVREDLAREDLLAEVPLVERLLEDRLVQALELGQGELGRQELEPDRLLA